jgi:osmotically-inducible protein OsmY
MVFKNTLKSIILSIFSTALLACASSATTESTGQFLDSATLTTKVKASLVDDLGTRGFAIKVKTYKGAVQLSGFVDNPMIKARAARISSGVEGVKLVRNNIIVK